MQSIFRISMHFDENNPEYYLHMPLVMIPYALQNFKKFAIFSKVIIEPATTLFGIGLYGSSAADLLVSGQHAPQGMVLKDYEYASNVTKYGPYTICRLPGELPRYELYASIEVLKQLWLDLSVHFKPILTSAWDLLDIHAGLPMIYPKTIDEFLPHHANLSILNGISYDKGCYLGQEVIARMQYRGKIKKHLYRALLEETHCPSPGDSVFTSAESVNESPGMVVRASISGQGTCELLVIMDEQYKNFENVRLYSADGPKLHRLDLPYSE
jgi:folate-binding protein YgfZ